MSVSPSARSMKSLSLCKRTLIALERKTKLYEKKTKPNLN